MLSVIFVLELILYVGIAWVIVKAYRHTHNAGFLIIGCAVLIWPSVGGLLGRSMHTSILRLGSGINLGWMLAFSIYLYQVIHAGLILIGLLLIARSVNVAPPSIIRTEH